MRNKYNMNEERIEDHIDYIEGSLPNNDEEAEERYERWRQKDPFPRVDTSILTSAQFCEYIAKTGMVYPFKPDKDNIQIATYDVALRGKYIDWTKKEGNQTGKIEKGDKFTLENNSICFVTLEPYFRIPEYIVLRFNLRISNVYKGLLLGTGPIVDPGFEGRLSIPLHNLTNNDYVFTGGKTIISFEFEKINYHPYVDRGNEEVKSKLHVPFFEDRSNAGEQEVGDYLEKAAPNEQVKSSIPAETERAEEAADKAERFANYNLLAAIVTVMVGFSTVASLAFDLGQSALRTWNAEIESKSEQIEQNKSKIDSLRKVIKNMDNDNEN